jgi:integrase/recombinase XerD
MSRMKSPMPGPLFAQVEGLRRWLTERGYAALTQAGYERTLAKLSRWLQANEIEPNGLTVDVVARFVDDERARRGGTAGPVPGLSTVLRYLHSAGVCPVQRPSGPADLVVEDYRRYVLEQRGLAPLTVVACCEVVRRFVTERVVGGELDLSGLTVIEVHGFVLGEAQRLRRGAISAVLQAVRSFLRFLFATGVTPADLSGTLPAVTARPHATLPRAVEPATLTALLSACDRSTRVGLRDFAILTVLSRLGLRASEVAAMRLDDIDWRAGELVVHAKGGCRERLPIPPDVGQALAAYLQHGRPATTSRAVFLRAHAPVEALSRNGVVFVPRSAAKRAGLPTVGAHQLRHTAATRMLQGGATLRAVGQVLGHHRDQTTAIYASVHPRALQQVMRDWPGSTR